ncbi:SusC/RagA family TonB-linked outer membrane protein [Dyadobacter diqingensis]|uniref:SusC/RagA family TonB-linked outer membrane protein n=1 Tax=Dyadobacter diqingensis TaxID=2938121 RepID=UPI0020C193B7|nr:SusC/RagA family TonB-linked outer membrane protein [Dyadobacter diqingensis]
MNYYVQMPFDWWKIMRITCIQLFVAIVFACASFAHDSRAQQVLDRKVSLSVRNVSLQEALRKLERSGEVKFVYSENVVSTSRLVSVETKNARLTTVLDKLFQSYGITYSVVNDRIVLGKEMSVREEEAADDDLTFSAMPLQIVAKGVVTDEKGEGLPGVSIVLKGTQRGTTTNSEGKFDLEVPDDQSILVFSFVGYKTQELIVGKSTSLSVSLIQEDKSLNEVIVTALGVKRDEKALGYSVAQLDGSEISNVKSPNMLNALAGKVAGVNIVSTSTDAGSTALMTIRGQSSISKSNQPLFVVDGVPVANSLRTPNMAVGRSVTDYGSPIGDINPDDIETITILKGASAAALYGSRAGSGVVLITTKNGSDAKRGLGVTVNSTTMFDKIWQYPGFQNQYGTGDFPGTNNTKQGSSWGPRLDQGTKFVQWNSPVDASGKAVPTDWVSYPDRVSDFFRTGVTYTNNLAVTGNNGKGNFRLSFTNMTNQGVVPNTGLKRNTLDFAAGHKLNDKVRISTNIGYTNNSSDNRAAAYRESVTEVLYKMPANVDLNQMRNYWKPGREGFEQVTYDPGGQDNPFLIVNEETNGYSRNRVAGNIQAMIDITKDLSLMARTGLDFYTEDQDLKRPFSAKRTAKGGYFINNLFFMEQNTDFLLTYKKNITPDWFASVSVGANRMNQKSRQLSQTAGSLVLPNIYNVANAQAGSLTSYQWNSDKRINSVYGTGELAYKNMVFLNVTGRNDWSSTLPEQNNSFFYPSVSLSAVLTDILKVSSKTLSFAKLRANWSQVGSDTDPYQLFNTIQLTDWGSVKRANLEFDLKNNMLKPEIATSYEVGADLRFFTGGRLGLDITWYKTNNRNQIIKIPTSIAAGSSTKLINAGNIQNAGWEIGLNAVPVNTALRWEISANFTRNVNKVVELVDGVSEYSMGSADGDNIRYIIKEGSKIGDMSTPTWIKVPDGQFAGQPLLDANGRHQRSTSYDYVGNYNPDFTVGFNNTFTYKNVTLNFLIDWRKGGMFYTYPLRQMILLGTSDKTLTGRDAESGGLPWIDSEKRNRNDGMIIDGYIKNSDGTYQKNDKVIAASDYYDNLYNKYYERSMYESTFIKLREASLTYAFKNKTLGKLPIHNLTVSLIGRNLFNWTAANIGFDPETSMSVAEDGFRQGVGHWTLPGVRSYGFKVGFNF